MTPIHGDDLRELESRQDPRLLKALDMVAPGTELREGIDNIIHARTGGLLVIGSADEIAFMFSGGLKLNVEYTPQLLYQVAKMDGAIVLDEAGGCITWANVQLMPDPTIHSDETGTRHRTAERVSKQTDALVIAISQRRDVVSLYMDGIKYILQDIPTVLSKANQGLAALDKYRARFDQATERLTHNELDGCATLQDVVSVLQRGELALRTAAEVERYIIELGTEGRLIEMQLEDTVAGVHADRVALVRDYANDHSEAGLEAALVAAGQLSHQELLDFGNLAEIFGFDRKVNTQDMYVQPRGFRALGRIPRLPRLVVEKVVQRYGSLAAILEAPETEIAEIEGVGEVRARSIRDGLERLREVDPVDPYQQS